MATDKSAGGINRRAHERKSVLQEASLRLDNGLLPCSVIDISVGGAQIELKRGCENGQAATLLIEKFGEFEGQVAWVRKGKCGLKFSGDPNVIAESLMAMATYGT
ncbi:MAG: PilZ domain-containing protein [Rhodospirillales bacterium]|jgi:hypothetical protein|nr:PilZ domain-containing protein [Rhodospirillales bacterium]MDP6644028.1 PilZ domain-containing protein [Rhodospirillales bacterium]|tara:strand:+ start:2809 stop:3123 length:315 start_codon:yes stop_codon:yes gene_type:complete